MPTLRDAANAAPAIPQANAKPAADDAAKAKALINFLMQDRFFLALYRSNDPEVRTSAIDKLTKAHRQAYGVQEENARVAK